MVLLLSQTGRIEPNYPKVCGHQGNVLDIKWNPFIENVIASCSEDTSVSRLHQQLACRFRRSGASPDKYRPACKCAVRKGAATLFCLPSEFPSEREELGRSPKKLSPPGGGLWPFVSPAGGRHPLQTLSGLEFSPW